MIKRKPFSTPSWLVGRDFPDPNLRPPGTLPTSPAASTQPIPTPPTAAPEPIPPIHPDEGRAASPAPPSALPPPAPPQSAPPPADDSRRGGPSAPPAVRPPSDANPQPPISEIQNNYHTGKCSICNHPDRDLIETAFLNWEPAERIVADFKLPARSTIYRHAKAADLLIKRRNNLCAALDQLIEQVGRVPATASSIVSAIELSYRLGGGTIVPLQRYETTHIYINEPNCEAPRTGGPSEAE